MEGAAAGDQWRYAVTDLIQVRRGTTTQWATANPVLAQGEPGFDTTTGDFRIGDGVSPWSLLYTVALGALQGNLDTRYVSLYGGVTLTDAAQTITTSTSTDVTWGTEVSDSDGWTAGGIALVTVPAGKGGRYAVTYSGVWSGSAPNAGAWCEYSGVVSYAANESGLVNVLTLSFVRTMAAGDTLKFRVFHAAGVNRDIVSRLEVVLV